MSTLPKEVSLRSSFLGVPLARLLREAALFAGLSLLAFSLDLTLVVSALLSVWLLSATAWADFIEWELGALFCGLPVFSDSAAACLSGEGCCA